MEETWECIQLVGGGGGGGAGVQTIVRYPYRLQIFYNETSEFDLILRAYVQDQNEGRLPSQIFQTIDLSLQNFKLSIPEVNFNEAIPIVQIERDVEASSFDFKMNYTEKFSNSKLTFFSEYIKELAPAGGGNGGGGG